MSRLSVFAAVLVALTIAAPAAVADGETDATETPPEYCVVLAPGYVPPAEVDPENCDVPEVVDPDEGP